MRMPPQPEERPAGEFGALQVLVDGLRGGVVQADGAALVVFSRKRSVASSPSCRKSSTRREQPVARRMSP
jgi:hypothetical protein